ncbi:MAG: hypothetical protein RI964_2759 [Pseudomonadota bacterium]
MNKSVFMAVAMAALSSSSSFAGDALFGDSSDDSGAGAMYGGASIGKSGDDSCNSLKEADTEQVLTSMKCNSGSAWKAFAGYKVTPNIAVEGSYVDFGETETKGTIPIIPLVNRVANDVSLKGSATGFGVTGVISTPVTDEISLIGKAGVMSWEENSTLSVENFTPKTVKTDGVDLSLGAGAEYKINDNWGMRGEYEHVNGLNANMYSVGAVFSSF